MPTYFSAVSLLIRDFARTEQRFAIPVDGIPDAMASGFAQDEWRQLNEVNLSWFVKVLSNAMQKPVEDEAWFSRAIEFSDHLRSRLDGSFSNEDEFTFNEPF